MRQAGGDRSRFIRAFQPERDVLPLVHLLATVEASDHTGEDVSEKTIRERLTLTGHDPARDRWVAVAPGENGALVGWSLVWRAPGETLATLDVAVHPHWRGQGLGSALLARALNRAGALGAKTVGAYVGERVTAGNHFAIAHGFRRVAANTLLRVESDVPLPTPSFPADYTLRSYADVNDASVLLTAFNRCYGGLWGHHAVSPEMLAEWLPLFRPEHIFLLFGPEGVVVGMCRIERMDDSVPYVDAPGVVPECRALGLYIPLLLAACAEVRQTGPRAVEVESWGDADATLDSYQRLGFAVVRRALAYERPLVAPAP